MPYADIEKKRAYNRAWSKGNRYERIHSPQGRAVLKMLEAAQGRPLRPALIAEGLGTTANSVGVVLDDLKRAGLALRIGYGQWVAAPEQTP